MKKITYTLLSLLLMLLSLCFQVFAADPEPPCTNRAGHSYSSREEYTPPTCTSWGYIHFYSVCKHCGRKQSEAEGDYMPTGHTPDAPVKVSGNTMTYTCKDCKIFVQEEFSPRYTGDMDLDFAVTAGDARKILRASVNLEKLNDFYWGMADVNNDSKITAADARTVLRMSVELEPKVYYNGYLRYEDEIFKTFLPSEWRGKYDIVKYGNTTEFRLKNSGKIFDITFVPDESYFIDGITEIIAVVSGKKTGYLITHAVTDLPCSSGEETLYMSMREDVSDIFINCYGNDGYTLEKVNAL